jgi:hypothetical protein
MRWGDHLFRAENANKICFIRQRLVVTTFYADLDFVRHIASIMLGII